MKLNEIQDLIKFVAKSGVSEVELESDGFKLVIKTGTGKKAAKAEPQAYYQPPMPMPPQVAQPAPAAAPATAPAEVKSGEPATEKQADNLITIKSPMIGTFYRKPSPDKPIFANVGDEVKVGQTVCIIEAMKLFNEIESEVAGKIVKVLVEDNSPVEYDQPLFLVEPK